MIRKHITKAVFLIPLLALYGSCGGVDVYLKTGHSCENKQQSKVEVVQVKPGPEYEELGRLSIRFSELAQRENAVKKLVEKSGQCGAQMLLLLPHKRVYNQMAVEASGESTGVLSNYIFELNAIMYRLQQ